MRVISFIFLCAIAANYANGAKILGVFPIPSKSHYILGETLLRGLAQRGHEVTMISPYTLEKPIKNYKDVVINGMLELHESVSPQFISLNVTVFEKLSFIYELFPKMYQISHNASNVREFVQKGEKYDLCIVNYMINEGMFGLCNAVQAPAIGFSLVGLNSFLTYHTNNPVPYSYVPSPFLGLSPDMTYFQRVYNLAAWYFFDGVMHFLSLPYQSRLLKTYYPDAPSMSEIMNNVDIYFMNTHISTDSPKPILPNIIPIGGFHLQIMDEIPGDIKKYLDDSKRGVIYFSLGSNAKSSDLDAHVLDAIIKALGKSNMDVLWKFEKDLPNKPKNIKIAQWMPQRPILMHPNVKVFMTHGGLGGTVEAIYGSVPMICMPLFGDQGKNCAESEFAGYAITVDLRTATEEILSNTIKKITANPSYKEKIALKSDLYRNQEINPMDKAIFWAEHVIRHKGAKHLKSRAASIPWYQYYLLDVISFLVVVLLGILSIVYFIIKFSLKGVCMLWSKISGKATCKSNQSNRKQKVKKQ